jgi:hypothetical protein
MSDGFFEYFTSADKSKILKLKIILYFFKKYFIN